MPCRQSCSSSGVVARLVAAGGAELEGAISVTAGGAELEGAIIVRSRVQEFRARPTAIEGVSTEEVASKCIFRKRKLHFPSRTPPAASGLISVGFIT
jgi:hypothetical protein